jgi:hypothetical protein
MGDAILSLFRTQMTHRKGGEMIYEISQVSLLDNDVRDAPDGPFDTFEEAQQLAKEYAYQDRNESTTGVGYVVAVPEGRNLWRVLYWVKHDGDGMVVSGIGAPPWED